MIGVFVLTFAKLIRPTTAQDLPRKLDCLIETSAEANLAHNALVKSNIPKAMNFCLVKIRRRESATSFIFARLATYTDQNGTVADEPIVLYFNVIIDPHTNTVLRAFPSRL
jgi:hypothetical protein